MENKSKPSTHFWFIPLLAGALLSICTNQLSYYNQQHEIRTADNLKEVNRVFRELAELSGEQYYFTIDFLNKLDKTEVDKFENLDAQYSKAFQNFNVNFLKDVSVLKYHFGNELADLYRNQIVEPLLKMDQTLRKGYKKGISKQEIEDCRIKLKTIEDKILQFNLKMMQHISKDDS